MLQKQQSDQSTELDDLARALRRKLLNRPADTASRAAARARDAAEALAARRHEQVDAAQAETLDDLAQLDQELTTAAEQVEERRRLQLLLSLADALPTLRDAQTQLASETEALEARRQQSGRLSRGELKRLQTATAEQARLQQDVRQLAERAVPLGFIRSLLSDAANDMQSAGERLQAKSTDAATLDLQRSAAQRLETLSTTLDQSAAAPPSDSPPSSTPPPPPGSGSINWIELTLLRTLQADLLRRAEALPAPALEQEPTAEETAAREHLAAEQAALASQAAELLQRMQTPPKSPQSQP